MRLITNNVGDDLRIMFYPCQESELGFVNINLSEINWPHNRFTWLGQFPGYPGPEQKSIWAGMDWARTGRIDVWSVINYQVCELCHQTTGAVTTALAESRFNFPISLVSRKSQSIWTLWIIHWFQWECLLAFQLITVWCVWPTWASGPPCPDLSPGVNSDDGHHGQYGHWGWPGWIKLSKYLSRKRSSDIPAQIEYYPEQDKDKDLDKQLRSHYLSRQGELVTSDNIQIISQWAFVWWLSRI